MVRVRRDSKGFPSLPSLPLTLTRKKKESTLTRKKKESTLLTRTPPYRTKKKRRYPFYSLYQKKRALFSKGAKEIVRVKRGWALFFLVKRGFFFAPLPYLLLVPPLLTLFTPNSLMVKRVTPLLEGVKRVRRDK